MKIVVFLVTFFVSVAPTFAESNKYSLGNDLEVTGDQSWGTVIVAFGNLDFNGKAEHVFVVGGDVTLRQLTYVRGSVVVIGGALHWEEGAQTGSNVVHMNSPPNLFALFDLTLTLLSMMDAVSITALVKTMFLLVLCFLCSLYYYLVRERLGVVLKVARKHPVGSVAFGVALTAGALVFVALCAMSGFGLLLVPFFFLFVCAYLLYGVVVLSSGVGQFLQNVVSVLALPYLQFLAGFGVLGLLWIWFPVTGSVVLCLLIPSVGAIFRARLRSVRYA